MQLSNMMPICLFFALIVSVAAMDLDAKCE